jgi:hypothetical protein
LPRQIDSLRSKDNVQGAIYFSSTTFDKNPNGWNDTLRTKYYREPALIPPMPWLPENPNRRANSTGLTPSAVQTPMDKKGI